MLLSVPNENHTATTRGLTSRGPVALTGGLVPATVTIFLVVHVLLWISVPLLFIDGMHLDALEMAAWGRDWALGYPKHPPLGTWLVSLAMHAPGLKIFNILVLSQLCIVSTAVFIWNAVRLSSSQLVAAAAVILFLESASSTVFSVQLNHNLLSMPFEAALLYLGLKFLEKPATLGAIALGLVSGLAVLIKYEAAFFHLTLLLVAATRPRYRPVLTDPRFLLSAATSLLIVAPHLYWDFAHGWPTLTYAVSERATDRVSDYLASINNYVVGVLTIGVGPWLTLLFAVGPRRVRETAPLVTRLGWLIALLPFALLAALSLATAQVIRQGWLLPLAPAVFVGLAFQAPENGPGRRLDLERFAWRGLLVSFAQAALFAIFILVRSWANHPVAAYALDSSELSQKLLAYWAKSGHGLLSCIAVPEGSRSLTLGPVLYLSPEPKFVLLNRTTSLDNACPAGGLALIPVGDDTVPGAAQRRDNEAEISVSAETGMGSWEWRYRIFALGAK